MPGDEHLAMFSGTLPCNPLPFLIEIVKYVRENGTPAIRDEKARRMLWVLMAQSYGCLATIDLSLEWERLSESILNGLERTDHVESRNRSEP